MYSLQDLWKTYTNCRVCVHGFGPDRKGKLEGTLFFIDTNTNPSMMVIGNVCQDSSSSDGKERNYRGNSGYVYRTAMVPITSGTHIELLDLKREDSYSGKVFKVTDFVTPEEVSVDVVINMTPTVERNWGLNVVDQGDRVVVEPSPF